MTAVQTPVSYPAFSGPASIILANCFCWSDVNRDCLPGYGPLIRPDIPDLRYCSIHHSRVRNATVSVWATSFCKRPSLTKSIHVVLRNRSTLLFLRARSRSCSNISRSWRVSNNPFMSYHETSSCLKHLRRAYSALKRIVTLPAIFKAWHYICR